MCKQQQCNIIRMSEQERVFSDDYFVVFDDTYLYYNSTTSTLFIERI